jgi:hypothetical protein
MDLSARAEFRRFGCRYYHFEADFGIVGICAVEEEDILERNAEDISQVSS